MPQQRDCVENRHRQANGQEKPGATQLQSLPRSPGGPRWEPPPSQEALHGKPWHFGDPHSQYRFIKVLGTGHYGVTYLCRSLKSGEYVAIKALDKLHPEYERDTALEEILILAALCDHPNVVSLHEVWEDASYIFIVMEACLGGELFDMVVERKYFTEADAAAITAAILSVIQHCHSKGIIHRDLKPENFLLLREGELSASNLRAIDFGLSKFVGRDGICRRCVGSSYYVAPEVLKGAYSYEADAWSVGTITYILLSGFPPFWGSSDQVIFHRILNKPVDFDYQPWHQVSAAAKDFVARLLDKDAASRMTVSQALAHPWITREAGHVPLSTEIISRLKSFTHQNRVKCLLMTVAANHLSEDEIGSLRQIFHFIDADHDGEISLRDLTLALQHAGLDMEHTGIHSLLAGLDLSRHGTVFFEEFIAAALDHRKVLTATTVNAIFAELDGDRDGLITVADLRDALEECHVSIKPDTLARLMEREGALDHKGMVSAKSFSNLLMASGDAVQPVELDDWMQDVRQFSAASGLRQLAMLVVARQLEAGEAEGLRRLFQDMDPEAGGAITPRQLQGALRFMGKQVGDEELRQLVDALDLRRRGAIEYDEFLAACLDEEQLTEEKLRAAFDFFDRHATGAITEADVAEVLREVEMDEAQANELWSAAVGSSCSSSPAASERRPPAASCRTLSYDDFRRLLLNQPPSIVTQALGSPNNRHCLEVSAGELYQQPNAAALAPHAVLQQAAAGSGGTTPTKGGSLALGRPPLSPSPIPRQPQPLLQLTGHNGPLSQELEASPRVSPVGLNMPGPEPPSPTNLMPRHQPPSPVGLQPREQFTFSGVEPPSPINLMPRQEPPSPGSAGSSGGVTRRQSLSSPPYRPYTFPYRTSSLCSPVISLASRHGPPSPLSNRCLSGGGLASPEGGSTHGGASGMTLQHVLQQYSSSGYTRPSSRRASLEAPRDGSGGVCRDSLVSQYSDVSESWLGDN